MHESEVRALRRAAILLISISALRWGCSPGGHGPRTGADSVLPELLEASREAASEGERRSRALADGERIDPNRADDVELDRLPGIGPSTARAIVATRDSGVVFRGAEDLLTVPGIGAGTVERIRSALAFPNPPRGRSKLSASGQRQPVDVNRADLESLQTLPGIGPAIAERILVARRERLFTSLDDLVRVKGIGPATVDRLRPGAVVGSGP